MTRTPGDAEEHQEGHAEEELLRVVLGRATPSGWNPRRVQEIRRRVVARRRRRVALTGAAAVALAVAVTTQLWDSPPARDRTAATPEVSWAPPGFTGLPLSGLSAGPSAGWRTVLRPDGKPGTAVVAAFSPRASAAPLTPVVAGGALVFYVQTEAGGPRAAVRRLDRVEGWCARAGGSQELMRIVAPAEDGHAARTGYACLNNASPTVIQQTTEILATATATATATVGR
ncbi:hypothetical protein ABZ642_08465 [Streptomyces sp. NPDC007157]|uniref:hypothetical protein n=1 Tax=Streptomyces sp. NPDC007157 TaxID=3154681 RepID=UPI0033DD2843